MQAVKAQVAADWTRGIEASQEEAFRLVKEPARRPDFREGVAAFTEKRRTGVPTAASLPPRDQLTTGGRTLRKLPGVTGLLDGVTVVETGVLMTVDFLGRLLGDEGADVVKVETPQLGDYLRNIMVRFAPDYSVVPPRAQPQQAQRHRATPARPRVRRSWPGCSPTPTSSSPATSGDKRQARARLRVGEGDQARHRLLPGHRLRRDRARTPKCRRTAR